MKTERKTVPVPDPSPPSGNGNSPYIENPFDANALEHTSGLKVRTVNLLMIAAAVLFLLLFLDSSFRATVSYDRYQNAVDTFIASELAANQFRHSCDDLISRVRMFAITTDSRYMDEYFQEVLHKKGRENAIATLKEKLPDSDAALYLEEAHRYSKALMKRQYHAIRLVAESCGYGLSGDAAVLASEKLTGREQAMTPEELLREAVGMTHDAAHQRYVERIDQCVKACIRILTDERVNVQKESAVLLNRLAFSQRLLVALLLAIVLLMIVSFGSLVMFPMNSFVHCIRRYQPLPMVGSYELRYLASAYNIMYAENQRTSAHLRHEAEHDALTALYNRSAFNKLREEYQNLPFALMLLDVDLFKRINDNYGHDVGDRVLQKIARLLDHNFRDTDFPCRIGGDEFAVIMTDVSSGVKEAVRNKLERISAALKDTSDGLPPVTLSVGAAFNDRTDGTDDIYKDADKALYVVKTHGRDGCEFYGEQYIKL